MSLCLNILIGWHSIIIKKYLGLVLNTVIGLQTFASLKSHIINILAATCENPAFEDARNVRIYIIPRMRKVSSGLSTLLSYIL